MAGRGKSKMRTYEAKDRVGDRRMGIKEGTSRDMSMDMRPPPKPRTGPVKSGKMMRGKR